MLISYSDNKKNSLELQEHSNILIIDPSFKQAKIFIQKLETQEHDLSKIVLGEVYQHSHNEYSHLYGSYEEVIEKPDIASTVGQLYGSFDHWDLSEIIYDETNSTMNKLFRVSVSVIGIQPMNLYELTQLFCSKCFQVFSFKNFNTNPEACPACQQN